METLGKLSAWAARLATVAVLLFGAVLAHAQGLEAEVAEQVRALALAGTQQAGAGLRVEIEVGRLDPRLRLAPCQRIEPYLPPNARLWGRSRIGLRCTQGVSPWNVYLPIQVKVFGTALVAAAPLPVGTTLTAADLAQAEVDLAEDPSAVLADADVAVGRTLARALNPGQGLRQSHLKARQWFAAGETVKVVARGAGFSVAGEGQALTAGVEGQPARVRTESGRVLTGLPTGERKLELVL